VHTLSFIASRRDLTQCVRLKHAEPTHWQLLCNHVQCMLELMRLSLAQYIPLATTSRARAADARCLVGVLDVVCMPIDSSKTMVSDYGVCCSLHSKLLQPVPAKSFCKLS